MAHWGLTTERRARERIGAPYAVPTPALTGARFVRARWSALLDHDRHVHRRTGIEVPYLRLLHF